MVTQRGWMSRLVLLTLLMVGGSMTASATSITPE